MNSNNVAAIDPLALKWGPFAVHWYGVIIGAAVLIALWLCVREGQRQGIDEDHFYSFLLWALPVAIICARAYYVAFQWSYYAAHPSEIIAIWDGGIAIYGGIIGGAIVLYFYCQRYHLPVWLMLDIVAPTVLLGQAMGRWGNFINQEAFGKVTTRASLVAAHLPSWLINQMKVGGYYRIPTFLYESLWDFTGFVIIMLLRHRFHLFKRGEIALSYLVWYGCGRFVIEGMRTDSLMIGSTIRVSQLLSLILVVAALVIWVVRRRRGGLAWYDLAASRKEKE